LTGGLSQLGTYRKYGFVYPFCQALLEKIWQLPATRPDFTLEDHETLERYGLPATILHTPGHTPGHTCVLLADGTAFVGDLLGRTFKLGLQGLLATGWEQLPGSLESLQKTRPARVYTGQSRQAVAGALIQQLKA